MGVVGQDGREGEQARAGGDGGQGRRGEAQGQRGDGEGQALELGQVLHLELLLQKRTRQDGRLSRGDAVKRALVFGFCARSFEKK